MSSLTVYKSAPLALKYCTALAEEAKAIDSREHAEAIIREAKAYQAAFADIDGIKKQAGLAWVFAERTMGKARAAMPKAPAGRKPKSLHDDGAITSHPTTEDLGLTHNRSASMQKLAELSADEIEAIAEDLCASGKAVSPSSVLSSRRSTAKAEKVHAVAMAAFSADGPFGTAVIDPPWQVEKIDRDVRPNQDAFDYPSMSADEVTAFVTADDSTAINVNRAKAAGMLPGVADLAVVLPGGWMVFLELKAPGGVPSAAQVEFHSQCKANGAPYYVVASLAEAIEVLAYVGAIRVDMSKSVPPQVLP